MKKKWKENNIESPSYYCPIKVFPLQEKRNLTQKREPNQINMT